MYSVLKKAPLLILLLSVQAIAVMAQFVPRFEVGVNAGTLIYQGDLSPKLLGYTKSLSPAIGLYISKPIDHYLSLRLNLVRGRIGADESTYTSPVYRTFRNFTFSTSVTEVTAMLSWNPFSWIDRYASRKLSPYFFAGAGVTVLNVHRDWSRFDPDFFGKKSSAVMGLGVDTLTRTPGVIAVLPVGAGVKYMVSDRVSLNAEFTYRLTSSDLIDGFKYAADPKSKDYYYGLSAGLSYRFGYSETDCPRPIF